MIVWRVGHHVYATHARSIMACGGGRRYVVVGSHNARLDPSSVTDDYWVWVRNPAHLGVTYGKWLVFGRKGSVLDSKWHKIHPLVSSGALGATGAKCSTDLSTGTSADDGRGVICVYTTREMRDEVGSRLIEEVRETIRYKSDEATLAGLYVSRGHKGVCEKTLLYWQK